MQAPDMASHLSSPGCVACPSACAASRTADLLSSVSPLSASFRSCSSSCVALLGYTVTASSSEISVPPTIPEIRDTITSNASAGAEDHQRHGLPVTASSSEISVPPTIPEIRDTITSNASAGAEDHQRHGLPVTASSSEISVPPTIPEIRGTISSNASAGTGIQQRHHFPGKAKDASAPSPDFCGFFLGFTVLNHHVIGADGHSAQTALCPGWAWSPGKQSFTCDDHVLREDQQIRIPQLIEVLGVKKVGMTGAAFDSHLSCPWR